MSDKLIGFIGQGWIGKNYADDFENRGHNVIRYALEEPHIANKEKIADCDIVFIAVPTPSTVKGFDDSILRDAIKLVGKKKTAVLKSTLQPQTTEKIQKDHPEIYVIHSPEFLTEATAAYDAANPQRNIMGIPVMSDEYKERAREVLDVLPPAPHKMICSSREAELIKYGGNCWFYTKVIFINMLHDLAIETGCRWDKVRDAMAADPRIGRTHLDPIHKSGRGAGGHCFIKDFAAFTEIYERLIGDELGLNVLNSMKEKNIDLLNKSKKDLDLLFGVYGEDALYEENRGNFNK